MSCHVSYIRVIPRSQFIMDGLLTDRETTVGTYEICYYGGEQYDRRGTIACQKLILAIFQVDIGVKHRRTGGKTPGGAKTDNLPEK